MDTQDMVHIVMTQLLAQAMTHAPVGDDGIAKVEVNLFDYVAQGAD